ncbi:DUF805 domain-containing protein [Sphingopyxis panaciterrae]
MKIIIDAYRRAFDFKGRSTRPEFWVFAAFFFVGAGVAGNLDETLLGSTSIGLIGQSWLLIHALPMTALGVRRIHDVGNSGWWMLTILLGGFGLLLLAYFAAQKGSEGPNLYGPENGSSDLSEVFS